jgi:hypothetical protein
MGYLQPLIFCNDFAHPLYAGFRMLLQRTNSGRLHIDEGSEAIVLSAKSLRLVPDLRDDA